MHQHLITTVKNKFVPNQEVVPVFDSDFFAAHSDRRFAALHLASGDGIIHQSPENLAYMSLRGGVYGPQTGILDDSHLDSDGREKPDIYDGNSEHFVVLENLGLGRVAMGACMRLIRWDAEEELPFAKDFPELMKYNGGEVELDEHSIEVSRFIGRFDGGVQKMARQVMFQVGLGSVEAHSLYPAYATVEPILESELASSGIPLSRISATKSLSHYSQSHNVVVKIDSQKMVQQVGVDRLRAVGSQVGSCIYWGKLISNLRDAS